MPLAAMRPFMIVDCPGKRAGDGGPGDGGIFPLSATCRSLDEMQMVRDRWQWTFPNREGMRLEFHRVAKG